MTQAWAPQTETVNVGDGDISTPLLRVRDKYLAKAKKLYVKAQEDAEKRALLNGLGNWYGEQADKIQALINQ
jgi:hypothetical protein